MPTAVPRTGRWVRSWPACNSAEPKGLPPWSVPERLTHWLAQPPRAVPTALIAELRARIVPLSRFYRATHFVHGDWGEANVLADKGDPYDIVTIIDFEDAHRGDPAEDFKWQLAAGPPWQDYTTMAASYADAGGSLGPDGPERAVLSATEWCLDLLSWTDSHGTSPYAEGALGALDAFVSGWWPETP